MNIFNEDGIQLGEIVNGELKLFSIQTLEHDARLARKRFNQEPTSDARSLWQRKQRQLTAALDLAAEGEREV